MYPASTGCNPAPQGCAPSRWRSTPSRWRRAGPDGGSPRLDGDAPRPDGDAAPLDGEGRHLPEKAPLWKRKTALPKRKGPLASGMELLTSGMSPFARGMHALWKASIPPGIRAPVPAFYPTAGGACAPARLALKSRFRTTAVSRAAIAQLDRATDYGSVGWGFDSSWLHQLLSSSAPPPPRFRDKIGFEDDHDSDLAPTPGFRRAPSARG